MFHSILVPLDGSSFSERALPLARGVAHAHGASLRLAHVHVPVVSVEVGGLALGEVPIVDTPMDTESRVGEQSYLQTLQGTIPEVSVNAVLLDGTIVDALAEYLSSSHCDLVVIATHGRGQMSRIWYGSTTDALIRRTNAPLLVINANAMGYDESPRTIQHIIIALDGSTTSENILETAVNLGQPMGACITLLQVIEPLMTFGVEPMVGSIEVDREATMRRWDDADRYLQRVAEQLRNKGLTVATRPVIAHQAAATILEEARRSGADLIAMSTHGRSGFSRLLMGSVADAVICHAHAPVLLLRPETA